MRKIFKLIPVICLAVSLFSNAASAQTRGIVIWPGDEEPKTMTICYYGVTMEVSPKIAKRYMKIGATMGACGEKEPEICKFPFIFNPRTGECQILVSVPESIMEKPADSEKAIQLDQPIHSVNPRSLSSNTRQEADR